MRRLFGGLFGVGLVLLGARDASATTVDITTAGWIQEDGNRFEGTGGNRNFVIGDLNLQNPTRPDFEHRAYFVWDLSGVTEPVTSARFEARNVASGENGALSPGYASPDATETLNLYDVTNDAFPNGFADLGSGILYGTRTVSAADNGTFVTVMLDQDAIVAINAAIASGQRFAIGGALSTLSDNGQQETIFAFSHANSVVRLVLNEDAPPGGNTAVPEPGTLALAAMGALGVARSRAARRS